MNQERILRIKAMELLFAELLQAVRMDSFCPETDSRQKEALDLLLSYYESPLWRSDYEADERGELPRELKRGILSEDGFYHFLTEIRSREKGRQGIG